MRSAPKTLRPFYGLCLAAAISGCTGGGAFAPQRPDKKVTVESREPPPRNETPQRPAPTPQDDRGIDRPTMTTGTYLACQEISVSPLPSDQIKVGCNLHDSSSRQPVSRGNDGAAFRWQAEVPESLAGQVQVAQMLGDGSWQQIFVFSGLPRADLARLMGSIGISVVNLATGAPSASSATRQTLSVLLPTLVAGTTTAPTTGPIGPPPSDRPPNPPPSAPINISPSGTTAPLAPPPEPVPPEIPVTVRLVSSGFQGSVVVDFSDPTDVSGVEVTAGVIEATPFPYSANSVNVAASVRVPLDLRFVKNGKSCSGTGVALATPQTINAQCER